MIPLLEGDYSSSTREFLSAPPGWVTALLIIPAILVIVGLIYRREASSASVRGKWLLGGLRVLAILILLLVLYEPVEKSQVFSVTRSVVAVVMDESASMDRKESYEDDLSRALETAAGLGSGESVEDLSRADLSSRVLTNPDTGLLDRLKDKVDVEFMAFAREVRPLSNPGELEPIGEATALGDAILAALDQYRHRNISGVIVISDGQQNTGRDPAEVARIASGENVPVYTVGVGNPEPPRNVAILEINAPDVALVNDEVAIEITLRSEGYEGEGAEVIVTERNDNLELESRGFILAGRKEQQTEIVYFKPEREGDYSLEIRIPTKRGELFEDDNVRIHPLRVEPEVIRVLYVEGRPRWEYRYLKNHLLRAENFKVQCLLTSASGDFIQESSDGVASLTRFPPTRLDLFEYDVLILGDVAPDEIDAFHSRDTTTDLLRDIHDFVNVGGGLILLAGELHTPRDYRDSLIADVLPVEIGNPEEEEKYKEDSGPFRPALPDPSHPHNIVRLEKDPDLNRMLLEDPSKGLAPMRWYAPVRRKKRGATVLLEHPLNSNRDGPHVLAATTRVGDGRTLYVGFDETWLWRKPYGDRYPERFWRSAVRHVAIGKLRRADKRFDLRTDKERYNLGEVIQLSLRVLDSDFRESTAERQVVHVEKAEGAPEVLDAYRQEDGLYERAVRADRPGTYRFWMEDISQPDKRLSARVVEVQIPRVEILNPSLDRKQLEEIAEITQGRYRGLHQFGDLVEELDGNSRRIPVRTEQESLWDRWQLLILVIGLLATEWGLRKRFNLL